MVRPDFKRPVVPWLDGWSADALQSAANPYIHSANRVSPLSRPSARAEIAAARPKIPV
jgi:hypothetical protein